MAGQVGRAVLCAPERRYAHKAACRGLPALPVITEALHKHAWSALNYSFSSGTLLYAW
jgi:hypothetical protein